MPALLGRSATGRPLGESRYPRRRSNADAYGEEPKLRVAEPNPRGEPVEEGVVGLSLIHI